MAPLCIFLLKMSVRRGWHKSLTSSSRACPHNPATLLAFARRHQNLRIGYRCPALVTQSLFTTNLSDMRDQTHFEEYIAICNVLQHMVAVGQSWLEKAYPWKTRGYAGTQRHPGCCQVLDLGSQTHCQSAQLCNCLCVPSGV